MHNLDHDPYAWAVGHGLLVFPSQGHLSSGRLELVAFELNEKFGYCFGIVWMISF